MKPASRILAAFLPCIAFAVTAGELDSPDAAAATRSGAEPSEQLGARFAALAGSRENAVQLARALNRGKVVALRTVDANGNATLTAFDLPGGALSWDEVQSALALAQSTLARVGIGRPTGDEVRAALLGGSIHGPDGAAVSLDGAVKAQAPRGATGDGGRAIGLPTYGPTPELPEMRPSAWAMYRPSARPSTQIEHQTGVVSAGFLR